MNKYPDPPPFYLDSHRVLRAIRRARRNLLLYFEHKYGSSPDWGEIKRRLFEEFGDCGLERAVNDSGVSFGDGGGNGLDESNSPKK